MKRVLVLDADQRSALAVTRSLGKRDITVFTADETPASLAGSSRYCKQYFTCPSPRLKPEQFIEFVCKLANEKHLDIMMPMTELTTTLLLKHRNLFTNTAIPFPEEHIVESLANKYSLMKMAEALDIPVPHTQYVDNTEKLPDNLESLTYPVVLKPGKSWLFHENSWSRAAVRFANNPVEAKKILESYWAFRAHPYMIQENVAGYGAGVFAIYDRGKPLALFAHRRLREKPPSGGVSVLSESIEVDPVLGNHARALLDNADWHGVAMVEFKVASDGTPYLMEINTRFWGSLQLAIDAGVDFPYMLYQLTCGEHAEPVSAYKTGIRLHWLLGDIDNLYLTLRDSRYSLKTKFNTICNFFTLSPKSRLEVNRWGDTSPAWYELKQYLKDIRR